MKIDSGKTDRLSTTGLLSARGRKLMLQVALVALLCGIPAAWGDYVGTLTNRIFFDPEGLADILDGYDVGDEIAFIFETTPAPTGDRGIAAWSTIYVPPGVVVIDAHLVQPDGDGTYSKLASKDVAAARDDCGNRGCVFATSGTYQNGRVNEVQQDTGVFYSTSSLNTLIVGGLPAITPTGVPAQIIYNQWDYNRLSPSELPERYPATAARATPR